MNPFSDDPANSIWNEPSCKNNLIPKLELNAVLSAGIQISKGKNRSSVLKDCALFANQIVKAKNASIHKSTDDLSDDNQYVHIIKKVLRLKTVVVTHPERATHPQDINGSQIACPIWIGDQIDAVLCITYDDSILIGDDELRVVEFLTTLTGSTLARIGQFKDLMQTNSIGENAPNDETKPNLSVIKKLTKALKMARNERERAITSDHRKSQFLAQISHELRGPIGSILNFSELGLRYRLSQGDRDKNLRIVCQTAKHLLKLTANLTNLSKIESGQTFIEKLSFDPCQLIVDVVDSFKPQADSKSIALNSLIQQESPFYICSDPTIFRQILTNLVGNAVKFTKQGEVSVSVELKYSDEKSEDTNQVHLMLEVRDSGIGMNQKQLERIFKPYAQGDASIPRRYGGTGLGLAITKKLLDELGGQIEVISKPQEGSLFRICLPVERSEEIDRQTSPPNNEHQDLSPLPQIQLPGCHIVVADDIHTNQEFLKLLLCNTNAKLSFCDNGQQVLDALRKEKTCDLLLLDMDMPLLNGYETTRRLRASGHVFPIIALTANTAELDSEKCMEAGCSDYLSKPVDINELMEKLALVQSSRNCQATRALQ